jgi:hypothetical protein
LVIDAEEPDGRTDRLLGELSPMLSSAGLAAVRLVLSSSGRYARTSSCAPGVDLIAADGPVVITPHGYALVRPAVPVTDGVPPQWYRRFPDGNGEAAGALAPSPPWERMLADVFTAEHAHDLRLRRVPAGLALARPEQEAWLASTAQQVWPDPERLTIVIDGTTPPEVICRHLAGLLTPLARQAPDGIRLHWPRAGVGGSGSALAELAGEIGVDLIVPAADVSACGFGGICRGPSGAAPWLQFGRDGSVNMLGSLYPVPAWEDALAEDGLADPPSGVLVEDVAAGLCVYRPGPSQRGLRATARSILPDPGRVTIVAGGDADAVHDVAAVLERLPARAATSVRLLLAGPASGGESYAQDLADRFECAIVAPAGRWTATPDGRVRALARPGTALRPGDDGWRTCRPRRAAVEPPPATAPPEARAEASPPAPAQAVTARPTSVTAPSAEPAPVQTAPVQTAPVQTAPVETAPVQTAPVRTVPVDSVPVEPAPVEPAPVEPAPVERAPVEPAPAEPETQVRPAGSVVAMLSRDHRSTTAERAAYRESAADFQRHSVSVRQMMTQRPGLRAAAGGEAMEAVATDFTAVLDLLGGDRRAAAAGLRTRGTAGSPRVACALSGLRRLPSFTGAVFSSAGLPAGAAGSYSVGSALLEPAFVEASSSHLVTMQGDVEYVIWSQTGKRMAALAASAGRDEIIFTAGTSYRVLRVDSGPSGTSRLRVFLREFAISGHEGLASAADGALDDTDRRVAERLVLAAAQRDLAATGDHLLPWGPGAIAPIGLDDHGFPFSERSR